MAPFITEELFSLLKQHFSKLQPSASADKYTKEFIEALQAECCATSLYPSIFEEDMDLKIEVEFAFMEKLVYAVRNIRAEMKLPPNVKTDLHISGDAKELQIVQDNDSLLHALLRIDNLNFSEKSKKLFGSTAVVGSLTLLVPLPEELQEQEKKRLSKEQEKLLTLCSTTQAKLKNKDFCTKAPQAVVEKMQNTLDDSKKKLKEIEQKLKNL